MRKIIFILIAFTGFINLHAQLNINADCISAIPLCSTPNFTFNSTSGVGTVTDIPTGNNISNPQTNPASNNAGCLLADELKPQWLLITIGNAGFLEFVFGAGNSPNPQVGFYDWAMWPYTPSTCAQIQNNTLPPVRCNWNGSSSGGTGIASPTNIPPGGSASNFEPPLAVTPCQQFIICISNFSGVNTLVSFQSLGTASLSCNPNCLNVNSPKICAGSSTSIVAVSSGNLANTVYSLNPGGFISPTPTFVITPSVSAAYTVYATGVNNQSTTVTQTAVSNVTVNPQPLAVPVTTQATCLNPFNAFNLGLGFIPANASPSYTINWSPVPAGILSPTQTAVNGTVAPGVYMASITAAGGCSTITQFTINSAPAAANISLTPGGPIYTITCYQPTITINAVNANYNYTWTSLSAPPIYTSSGSFNNTGLGTWVINAINPVSGCAATKTIFIAQNTLAPVSNISPTLQNITCINPVPQTLTLTSNLAVNITHNIYTSQQGFFSANTQSAAYVPAAGIGTYVLTNMTNGCSTTKTFTVQTSPGFPTFSVLSTPANFTLGCSTKSLLTINVYTATGAPPGSPVSYSIMPPNTSSVLSNSVSLLQTNVFSVTIPGTWTVVCRNDANACDARLPITVLQNTLGPGIDTVIVPQYVLDCNTPTMVIEGYSQSSNIIYNWSFGSGPVSVGGSSLLVGANTTVAPTNTLINNYTLTVTDNSNLCKSTTVIPVYQNLFPPKTLITNGGVGAISCKTPTVLLTNSSSSGIPPNVFPIRGPVIGHLWQGPSPQPELQQSSTYLAEIAGTYTLYGKDIANGCITATVITVRDDKDYPVVNNPITPKPSVLDCGAEFASLKPIITGNKGNLVYTWTSPLNAVTSPATGEPSQKDSLKTNAIGLYRVLVTNTLNGCAATSEMSVINGTLTGNFESDKQFGYAPLEVTLTNKSTSTIGNSSITSVWNYGNGTNSITTSVFNSPVVTYNLPGTYTIVMYATKGRCLDTALKVIQVEIPSELNIPNVFTPNGDNVNDIFHLKATNLDDISIKILDRWGHLVYELSTSNGNIAWDGKNQLGKDVPDGIYYYVLRASGKDGQSFNRKGSLSIFR